MANDGLNLRQVGPFEPGLLPSVRGQRMVWLTVAAEGVWDAQRAQIPQLIAKIQNPEAREACLLAIESLPSRSLRLLISRYQAKAKGR